MTPARPCQTAGRFPLVANMSTSQARTKRRSRRFPRQHPRHRTRRRLPRSSTSPPLGIWRLWVLDDNLTRGGQITAATLSVGADVVGVAPPIIDTPTLSTSYSWDQPFSTLGGEITNLQLNADQPRFTGTSRLSGTWRTQVDGVFYA